MGGMTAGRPLRTAEIIAVGSELLGSTRVDTNSLFLSERLASLGIELRTKLVAADDRAALGVLFQQALARADVVVITGGLGPTDDDVTRDAVSDVLQLPLQENADILQKIEDRFARRGLRMPLVNRKQALVLRGATVLDNPHGTAPGQLLDHGGRVVILLPGPPRELQAMMDALIGGPLGARATRERLHRAVLFVTGRSESHVEERAQPIYSRWRDADPRIETTILAGPGQIELHLTLRSDDPRRADAILTQARDELAAAVGPDVFSTDGRTMEQVVGGMFRDRGLTIAVAESCTGGLLQSRLTDVPGSSAWVRGGAVAYSNDAKTLFADVPPEIFEQHGAVSAPVAVALAEGIRRRLGASIGVGVTGIAGPTGGTPGKPVGTVVIAVVGPEEGARSRTFSFLGGRIQVKFQATQAALDMVRRALALP
jgi:nicotinamide-nucleotide amidase